MNERSLQLQKGTKPMTSFPQSPKLQRGSLIAIDQSSGNRTEIQFQYNPDTLTRRLTPQIVTNNFDKKEALRLKGPPQETISLEMEIDATDQVDKGDSTATSLGIHPTLAALELLIYPKSSDIDGSEKLAANGVIEITPFDAPLVLFVWGKKRSLPVRVSSFSITEEAFDPDLNPFHAKVSLELTVLTYFDLNYDSQGASLFFTHHKNKEKLAQQMSNVTTNGG